MPKTFFTLIFDPQLEQAVRQLWQVLADAGIDPQPQELRHRPHVTLAGYDLDDPSSCADPLRKLCSRHQPFPIRLHNIGIFPAPDQSVLFLEPRMTTPLDALHRAAVEELGRALGKPLLAPHNMAVDSWTPHCTLMVGLPDQRLGEAVQAIKHHWRPLEGQATGIGVLTPPDKLDFLQVQFGHLANSG